MAPPPEYDKEPKAPDKSATSISTEDSKLLHNLVNEQHSNPDDKPINTVAAVEVENNKHVETLDDGQLRALLDEAITYKCPKDREGKSSLFKELLEEVEQDEQACEAAARTLSGCRGARRGGRGRRALPHSNSLQDLVAALAAEPAPRRHHVRHHPPAAAHSNVSARAIHGGSLPSGVDTSSLLSEEPARGAGYLATVRCVNPPPLAERRVSASDANTPAEIELLNRRSKPMFPMTYTARATLEIGSGSVCSGRAVTTTTASNQVRTTTDTDTPPPPPQTPSTLHYNQTKLMNALCPKINTCHGGGIHGELQVKRAGIDETKTKKTDKIKPRGPKKLILHKEEKKQCLQSSVENEKRPIVETMRQENTENMKSIQLWAEHVDNWYKSLSIYNDPLSHAISNNNQENMIDSYVKDIETDHNNTPKSMEHNFISPYEITNRQNYSPDLSLKADPNYFMSNLPDRNREKKLLAIESHNFSDTRRYDDHIHKCDENFEHDCQEYDIHLRKKYKKQVGDNLVVPTLAEINPRNVRRMTIGQACSDIPDIHLLYADNCAGQTRKTFRKDIANVNPNSMDYDVRLSYFNDIKRNLDISDHERDAEKSKQTSDSCLKHRSCNEVEDMSCIVNPFFDYENIPTKCQEIELNDVSYGHLQKDTDDSFSQYVSKQQRLLQSIGKIETNTEATAVYYKKEDKSQNATMNPKREPEFSKLIQSKAVYNKENEFLNVSNKPENEDATQSDRIILSQIPNNACIFLTLPEPLHSPPNSNVDISSVQLLENNNNSNPLVSATKPNIIKKKKEKMPPEHPDSSDKKKTALDKKVFKVLLFENLFKNNVNENFLGNLGASAITDKEVDSAISFSCITTPEVVSSCNTTSSTVQSAIAVDPKPRSVISSSFNGLPLSRPNYGSTGTSASDDYKKSLDENGNSVQGFSSPLSGSSQHKKPRRKKSSKNETVIDCQQIDGYQGDKDVNELLRFIESNADNGRGAKLGRVKHKDDSDDKTSKKRSTERRKDKDSKMKRATSLEELSRTKIEDLTDVREAPLRNDNKQRRSDVAPAKAERRSWGDDARDALRYDVTSDATVAAAAVELTDFQTVTKKRKPRRRADEREPPRRARPPSPRARRESAPPSDRSNDSNDDMDSVHSLPAAPPPAPPAAAPAAPAPAPHASYAEIARTRHNIPDLIESCNFYAEGEGGELRRSAGDADGYPALEARAAARRRDAKPPPPAPRRERKERAPPAADAERAPAPAPDCPAPDVVADRRPPVILLDSAVRPRDMDGVTFGFDINEQLLSGGGRRARCDLVRDAAEAAVEAAAEAVQAAAEAVAAAAEAGAAPRHSPQLLQIVEYVATAWEDVVRCGGGKVRYFSE